MHAVHDTWVLQICSKANHYGGSMDPHAGMAETLPGLQLSQTLPGLQLSHGIQDNSCGQPGACMMLFHAVVSVLRMLLSVCWDSQLGSILLFAPAVPYKQVHAGMANILHGTSGASAADSLAMACVAVMLAAAAAFLLQRGIKTLALRVERQSANALALAAALEKHPLVSTVASMPVTAQRPGKGLQEVLRP
jgi:hypothetical protein